MFQKVCHGRNYPHVPVGKRRGTDSHRAMYLSSDDSEHSSPSTNPDGHHESIYPDSINQLIASQLEQRSNVDTETVFYPSTPNTSMISDDEEQSNLTPLIGDPEQYTSHIPQRRNHPIQLCQHL